jgi:phosphatidylglycerol:prolipoprotein diacylglycerol transferase
LTNWRAVIPYRTFPGFDLGPVTIRTFGVMVALGLLIGSVIFVRHGARHGIEPARLEKLAFWTLLLGIVGARILFVLSNLGAFVDRPWRVAALWEGGLEFSGGFLVAVAYLLWWLRRNRDVPGLLVSDGMALGLSVGLAVGRIGCYSVGEHLGGTTGFFLAVHYLGGPTREGPIPIGAHIHNTALYEILLLLPLIWLLFWMRRREVPAGWVSATFLLWYGVQRSLTDFLRAYDRRVFGLTGAQYVCIGLVAAGLLLAVRLRRSADRAEAADSPVI